MFQLIIFIFHFENIFLENGRIIEKEISLPPLPRQVHDPESPEDAHQSESREDQGSQVRPVRLGVRVQVRPDESHPSHSQRRKNVSLRRLR